MKREISAVLKKALEKEGIGLSREEIENLIEIPPLIEMGDFAFPCFFLASKLKKNPNEIALKLKEIIGKSAREIKNIQTSGGYLNFIVDKKMIVVDLIKEVLKEKDKYGSNDLGKGKKILVEYSSPNIAKPFGIGHLRSTIIGNSIANIAEFNGFKTIRMNYPGDWGTQFGKLMLGYKKFGNSAKLKKDPIKHLLEIYVKINKDIYDEESREWFKKLEQGDKTALELWKKFREMSLKDFEKLYSIIGIKFDVYSGESMHNSEMAEIIKELSKKNLLKKSEGAMIVDLKEFGLGVSLIQKTDGASLYITRDLAAAINRYKKYKFDKMIYEVGQEQKHYFNQLFKILELMGYGWAKDCVHVYHGLYLDKDGKKFATRKGKTIFMEDVINKTKNLAEKEIKKRFPKISKKELEKRAQKVAIAAIFYGDLKTNRKNDMIFDIQRFVSFEGNTGPYIQYSYARASSILKKAKKSKSAGLISEMIHPKEIELIKKILQFKDVVLKSNESLNPSLIANYSYELAQIFNEFYHECPVIGNENEIFRLKLVEVFRQVLKNSLGLLGIGVLKEM